MISICTRVSFLKLTSYVCPSPLSIYCYCKNHLVEGSWDTLDVRRLMPCFHNTTIGHGCTVTWRDLHNIALHAKKLSLPPILMVFTYLADTTCSMVQY
jgi:hypothetical protein